MRDIQRSLRLIESYSNDNKVKKAGTIPYIISDKGIEMLFMVSSDPAFGGPDPMISKGHIDAGETPEQAAFREAIEELGLKKSNCTGKLELMSSEVSKGLDSSYVMNVYGVEVKSKEDFVKPHYETAYTVWMTLEEFKAKGRRSHLGIVQKVVNHIDH